MYEQFYITFSRLFLIFCSPFSSLAHKGKLQTLRLNQLETGISKFGKNLDYDEGE